jgi:hypothetical protein
MTNRGQKQHIKAVSKGQSLTNPHEINKKHNQKHNQKQQLSKKTH